MGQMTTGRGAERFYGVDPEIQQQAQPGVFDDEKPAVTIFIPECLQRAFPKRRFGGVSGKGNGGFFKSAMINGRENFYVERCDDPGFGVSFPPSFHVVLVHQRVRQIATGHAQDMGKCRRAAAMHAGDQNGRPLPFVLHCALG